MPACRGSVLFGGPLAEVVGSHGACSAGALRHSVAWAWYRSAATAASGRFRPARAAARLAGRRPSLAFEAGFMALAAKLRLPYYAMRRLLTNRRRGGVAAGELSCP